MLDEIWFVYINVVHKQDLSLMFELKYTFEHVEYHGSCNRVLQCIHRSVGDKQDNSVHCPLYVQMWGSWGPFGQNTYTCSS